MLTLDPLGGGRRRLVAARHPAGAGAALEAADHQDALHRLHIELCRAVPLITVLFMASIMLPLFMPQGVTVDKLLRAMVGVTLFYGGLHGRRRSAAASRRIPRGQYEAASALGLGYWKSTCFIILPQALKHVIPGIVNNFISLFKDTSLVSIVGMNDLLNAINRPSTRRRVGVAHTVLHRLRLRHRHLLRSCASRCRAIPSTWKTVSTPDIRGSSCQPPNAWTNEISTARNMTGLSERGRHRHRRHEQVVRRLPRAARHQPRA